VAKPLPLLSGGDPLPARHEAASLIQHYFDNIYTLLPFFIETSFWTSVDAVYQDGGRFAQSFNQWFLRMILAIADASSSQHANDSNSQRARRQVSAAMKYAEDVLHPGSVTGIQAILLLAQYSMFDPEHFRTWYLVGIAVRVAVDLGLHQEQQSGSHVDPAVLDLRRRVFHCIYSLDRLVL
jgi:hypothetical protein